MGCVFQERGLRRRYVNQCAGERVKVKEKKHLAALSSLMCGSLGDLGVELVANFMIIS